MLTWKPYVALALGLLRLPLDVLMDMVAHGIPSWDVILQGFLRVMENKFDTHRRRPLHRMCEGDGYLAGDAGGGNGSSAGAAPSDAGEVGASSSVDGGDVGRCRARAAPSVDEGADTASSMGGGESCRARAASSANAGGAAASTDSASTTEDEPCTSDEASMHKRRREADAADMDPRVVNQRATIDRILGTSVPHEVLGISQDADLASVRRAYRHLALLVHPDKCSLPRTDAAFRAVRDAYEAMEP